LLTLGNINNIFDANTLGCFRYRLHKKGLIEEFFEKLEFNHLIQVLQVRSGQIMDATLVLVPRQGNSREDSNEIKEICTPEAWDEKPNE
jgi:hypothetical protein